MKTILALLSTILTRPHRSPARLILFLLLFLPALLRAQQYSWSTFAGAAGVSGSADSPGYFNLPFGIARDSSGNIYVGDFNNHVVRKITASGVVSTFAGQAGVSGSADGDKTAAARFNFPAGVALDSAGNVYVTDFGSNTIRKIDVNTGLVSTLAGTPGVTGGVDGTGGAASFNGPGQVTCDASGNLYLGDFYGHTIRKVTPAGVVTTLAGLAGNPGSADGTGIAARFYEPTGIAVDVQGTVYVGDEVNFTIRKITSAGVVTTLAGLAGSPGAVDGTGSAARFTLVYGLAFDSAGNLIVTERGTLSSGSNNLIRKVTPAGVVTTLAGLPGTYGTTIDGTGSNARFNNLGGVINDGTSNTLLVVETNGSVIRRVGYDGVCTTWVGTPGVAGSANTVGVLNGPVGIARAPDGTWYVAEYNTHLIRRITPGGVVSIFAGQTGVSGSADGTGTAAQFNRPRGIECDSTGNVWVCDSNNHTIRRITPAGAVTTLAGQAGVTGSTDGTGTAARFNLPYDLKFDSNGNAYVADADNQLIRKVTPAGVVTTLAGLAGSSGNTDGTGNAARFNGPNAVAVDATGNVFVSDGFNSTIRKVTPAGVVTTVAGLAGGGESTDGSGSAARFSFVRGLEFDTSGNLLISDSVLFRKMTPAGAVTTLCGRINSSINHRDGVGATARLAFPMDIEMDPQGNAYVVDYNTHTVRKVTPGGAVSTWLGTPGLAGTTNTGGNFNSPAGVARDSNGNLFVCDTNNHTIRKITPQGAISTFAGLAFNPGSSNGNGSAARFNNPYGIAVDGSDNLYVADTGNYIIRKITPAGLVSTLAGAVGQDAFADGAGGAARFSLVFGIAAQADGTLYVADYGNERVRKIAGNVVTTLAGSGAAGVVNGTGAAARFDKPKAVCVDAAGFVFVGDYFGHTLRKITPGGVVTTLAGLAYNGGNADGTGAAARFFGIEGAAVDAFGNVFVAEASNGAIRKVTATGVVTTIGGLAGSVGSTDGVGAAARFNYPTGITLDAAGNLYVGDQYNRAIRKGTRVGARARLVQPALGAALPAPTTVFQWEAGLGATKYVLYVGTTPGGYNLYAGDEGTNLSRTVSLPPDIKVYVTLYSLIGGIYQSNSYAFDPAPSAKAAIVSPVQGSTLTSATLNLQWSAATGASGYAIWVGSTLGGYDLGAAGYGVGANTATFTVPTDGGPVYVRLYSLINGAYQWNDYWFFTQTVAGNRPAKLNSNAPGPNGSTILGGGGVTFVWSADPGVGATSYAIWIGSAPDTYDIYAAATGTGTAVIPSNIPGDGRKIYVTLFSLIGGAYQSNSYFFICGNSGNSTSVAAQITSPSAGATLGGTILPVTWAGGQGVSNYVVWVGSVPGGYDIAATSVGLAPSTNVTVPTDGRVLHVTLWSLLNGVYQNNSSWCYAFNSGPTARAQLNSHVSGASLTDANTTFTWNAGTGVTSYALWVGSTVGGYDLYSALEGTNQTRLVTLPTDGRKIYATLYSLINGVYVSNSYVFTAPKIAATKAVLTSPANGSTLTGSSVTLNWTAGSGATKYVLYVGSTPGGYDRYVGDEGTGLTRTVTNLPTDGRPLYVTLYSLVEGAYQAGSYVFNAWQSP